MHARVEALKAQKLKEGLSKKSVNNLLTVLRKLSGPRPGVRGTQHSAEGGVAQGPQARDRLPLVRGGRAVWRATRSPAGGRR